MTPEIVLGPPGTGKTTTLLGYVDDELRAGTHPEKIGYVSFTKRAATEAVTRACEKFSIARDDLPYFRTLHSLCFRHLGLTGADVMEGKRLQEFADMVGVKIKGRWSDDGSLHGFADGDRILFMENLSRIRKVTLREQYGEDYDDLPWALVDRTARAYVEFKKHRDILDYTDMLVLFAKAHESPRLEVLFVDEAQDLSRVQWDVVRKLARYCRRVVVAGDDDQAIYRWAGADVAHFVNMAGIVKVLGQSFRVPRRVQMLADRPLRAVRNRRAKEWRAREEDGSIVHVNRPHRVDWSGEDVLVLARNDYVLREQVEPYLRSKGIVYEKHGFPSVSRASVEAILIWERLRRGESVTGAEARVVYSKLKSEHGVARRYKSLGVKDDEQVSLEILKRSHGLLRSDIWHEALGGISDKERTYVLDARKHGERVASAPRVRLSTIHGAKGGQAKHVVLMSEMAHRTHDEMRRGGEEDEGRVWYVGVTRAIEQLTIVDSTTNRVPPWL